jgi:hypothetical protein
MKRGVVLLFASCVLVGCPKKDGGQANPAGSSSASALPASGSPTASAAPATDPASDPTAAANVPPPAPDMPSDPNAPPVHDDHDKQAAAQIHKANYKAELDKLEKEDLSADTK